jgi:hypothetical protein
MTELVEANQFYLRFLDSNKYEAIEEEMDETDFDEDLEKPIKKGTLCAAKFADDGNWYRARVV